MRVTALQVGDRVGIKDSADFLHWSRFGAITGIAGDPSAANGSAMRFEVLEDGETYPVPMAPGLLVKLAPRGEQGAPGDWIAQSFPTDGDQPGPKMYFENPADVLAFVVEFADLKLDEKLKVHGPAWTEQERTRLRDAGVELA
ncbi:MAG: hypothetical protein WDN04_20890 [Rhodospirillales bacterium]